MMQPPTTMIKIVTFLSYAVFDEIHYYFGGAQSKGFATLRNVSKLPFLTRLGKQSL